MPWLLAMWAAIIVGFFFCKHVWLWGSVDIRDRDHERIESYQVIRKMWIIVIIEITFNYA